MFLDFLIIYNFCMLTPLSKYATVKLEMKFKLNKKVSYRKQIAR